VTPVLSPSEAIQRGYLTTGLRPEEEGSTGPDLGEFTRIFGRTLGIDEGLLDHWSDLGAIR
jgi:hypothetical protein